ncbi:hypothetical protein BP5796_10296 [Coleophoma crateriformis]|uniref:Uncharacterized protein n=1 Tax=Coleophoma crateriformis TaxID=565419 RepID=A0A3D8QVR1_9HELO|nr:hypothetical protein BP5796_10296 [Coleophoma crateriformis]
MQLKRHTFRPITDSSLILPDIMPYHRSGAFAWAFQSRRLKLFISEMLNEETLYAATNSPEGNLDSLRLQVTNRYAPGTTGRILKHYELPKLSQREEWISLYGRIIADGQFFDHARPTDKERVLMERWNCDLVAFVNNERGHEYGTKSINEFKVATPEGSIEIQEDERWLDLLQLSEVFFGDESRS